MVSKKTWCVYKHTSPSGKCYIGITCRKPEWRWNHGKGYTYTDDLKVFKAAILKYGWDNFTHEVLVWDMKEEEAKLLEIFLIKKYKALKMSYNMTNGGDGYLGAIHMIGRKLSKETRKKMSNTRTGMYKGEKNPMYGRHETAPAYGKFGKDHPASKKVYLYSLDGTFIKEWKSLSDVQRTLGLLVTNITACCKGRHNKTVGGYIWKYEFYNKIDTSNIKIRKRNTTNTNKK